MKCIKSFLFCLLVLSALVLFKVSSHAALTKQLSYQGRLNSAAGQPVANGTYSVTFSIYNVSSGGAALYSETQNVTVENGGFSAYIGSVTPLNLPFNEDYFLGLKVGADPEMTPRLKLAIVGTSAFALDAGNAANFGGQPPSNFAPSVHNHDSNYSLTTHTHTATGVTQIVAGTNVTISGGTGAVTINASGGGGGTPLTPAATVSSLSGSSIIGTSANYAREDHAHGIAPLTITGGMLAGNTITDLNIASTAGIATSKLSGTVSAIPGNGLGALATMNAVGSPQIVDGSIAFADLSPNACTTGQIMKFNGTAWACDVDLTGGGGGVITNPTSTQTIIAGNATTSPLVLKSASAPAQDIFDVQDFAGTSFMKVNSAGNFLVGNPVQMAPKLSVEDASINPAIAIKSTGSGTALDAWKSGTSGSAGVFSITNAGNTSDLIAGDSSGTGNLLKLSLSGINKFVVDNAGNITVGGAANAVKNNPAANQIIQPTADIIPLIIRDDAASTAFLFDIQNNAGTTLVRVNQTGNLLVGNPTTTTAKVSVLEIGTANHAGYFEINNASSLQFAVSGSINGSGDAVYGYTTGTGSAVHGYATGSGNAVLGNMTGAGYAGNFRINNVSNASSILVGNTTGTGNLLQLQQAGVNKFVVDNTGNITVGGAANAVKTNPSVVQIIQPTADVVPLVIKDDALAVADLLDVQSNLGTSLVKVKPTGSVLVGNPIVTTAKVSAYETGTANNAGYFEINNIANTTNAVYGITNGAGNAVHGFTNGTGNAGRFDINNATNLNAAVYGTTNGTGPVIQGNTTNTGNLLQLQVSAVDKVVVNNAGNVLVGNPVTTTAKVSVEETGTTNKAGFFLINNGTNANIAVEGETTGTGTAGSFYINNIGSASSVVKGNTTGTGSLLQLQQTGVDKFVVDNTGQITVGGMSGVVKTSAAGIQTIIASAATVTPLVLKAAAAPTADIFDVQDSAATSLVKVNPAGKLIVGNSGNTAKVAVQVTDTTSAAGFFEIANVSNASPILGGNTTNITGNLLQLQQNSANQFVVSNAGNLTLNGNILAYNGTNSVPVTGVTQQLIQSGNTCEGVMTDGFITVTFGTAFSATPIATFGQTSGTAATSPTITAKTAASFTVSGFENTVSSECMDWIAIGNK